MESIYQVQISSFEGPLDLLLQLIEREKLSITEISLANVADQFLSYMESREQVPLFELSSFLSIAARLILIKSRSLLPSLVLTETEEESIEDLQIQLELYALFQQSAKNLQALFQERKSFGVRDRYLGIETLYFPPPGITKDELATAFQSFIGTIQEDILLPEKTLKTIISLEKRIADIQSLIATRGKIAFSEMMKKGGNREEKIVSFLALLELIKQKFIFVEQSAHFEEINIQKV